MVGLARHPRGRTRGRYPVEVPEALGRVGALARYATAGPRGRFPVLDAITAWFHFPRSVPGALVVRAVALVMSHTAAVRGVGISVGEEGMGAPAVLLEARDEILPIFIGASQAQSIEQARQDIPPERPMTHDLLIEMFTEVGGAIDLVRIDDLADNTFYAKVDAELIRAGERQKYVFDARPSDGIALAVRVGCPINVTDEVLDQAGRPVEEFLEDVEDDMEFREFEDS